MGVNAFDAGGARGAGDGAPLDYFLLPSLL